MNIFISFNGFSLRMLMALSALVLVALWLPGCSSGDDDDDDDETEFIGSDDDSDDDSAETDDDTNEPDDDQNFFDDDAVNDDAADDDELPPYGTRYPIVLCHGFMGWGYLEGFSNFYEVYDHLTANGFEVFEPWVSSINTVEERATELAAKIDEKYPGERVNLLCHSQGGVDARYLITTLGWSDRVASLTMLSTPNHGTTLADIAAGLIPGIAQDIIDAVLELFGLDWDGVYNLTTEFMDNEFNPATPDDPDVKYYSYQGNGEEIFLPLRVTHAILELFEGCNDGVIGCESAVWGQSMGQLPVDHFGIVGQPFGLIDWPYLQFYLDLANSLREEGF